MEIINNKNAYFGQPDLSNQPKKLDLLYTALIVFFVVALILAGGFYAYSYFFTKGPLVSPLSNNPNSTNTKQDVAAKDFSSPINGVMYSKEVYDGFKDRRPLAIMVDNHIDARPQYGINKADIVFEAVAEGGITRLMPVYYSQNASKVEPIRSARVHYVDLAAEFYAWYAHWGGAYAPNNADGTKNYAETNPKADAYQHIKDVGLANLDQMWLGDTAYGRDNSRINSGIAQEHTGYTSTIALWKEAPNRYPEEGWTKFRSFTIWKFKDDAKVSERGTIKGVSFNFWDDPNFKVLWTYDKDSNSYARTQGGVKIVDALDNSPTMAKDVIVQFTKETSANDNKHHLLYDIIGIGKAKIFMDGKVVNATWKKNSSKERTMYQDESGKDIVFNRGQIWVEIVPDINVDSLSIITE